MSNPGKPFSISCASMVAQLYHSCFAFPRIQSSSQGHRFPFHVYHVDVKGTSSKGEGEHPDHIPRISFCIEDKWRDPFPFHPFYGQVLSVFDWQPFASTGLLNRERDSAPEKDEETEKDFSLSPSYKTED